MAAASGPSLAELRFLPTFTDKPYDIWKSCVEAQRNWEMQVSSLDSEKQEIMRMKEYEKEKTLQLVWRTNILENTLPTGLTKRKALVDKILTQAYTDKVTDDLMLSYEPGLIQLVQHMNAFKYLCQKPKGSDLLRELTEDVIKKTHQIMMLGLSNEQGLTINAGAYRTRTVCVGDHVFPSYECIPHAVARIVKEYNKRMSEPHDYYELASWLHFNTISLHPFEDGNGRISQLLWCYSLMRDGLPFPTVLSSGDECSQKHLILCLDRDRDMLVSKNPHLTTLTVVSVYHGWKDYFKRF